MDRSTHLLTPTSLKALAHPIRVQLLGLLRTDGPATATGLAARLGESSGTTSYHLRQLAAADFVVEVSDRGNGRERWWRAAQQSTRLELADWQDDPEVRPALETYLGAVINSHIGRAQEWSTRWAHAPKKWRDAGTASDALLHLSAPELARLNDEVEAVVERFRREPRRGDEQVVVQWQSFPAAREP
jgi:DNA-binding transcriptional ArsR family regulator